MLSRTPPPFALSAAGASASTGTVIFSNSNGVSFGQNGNTITASVAAGAGSVNFSAGTASGNLASVVFSNSNLVSFGLNGGTITGSIPSSFAGSGFTTTSTAGAAVAGTHDSNGLKLAVPSYLTTAMLSNAATISNVNVSAGTTSQNLSAMVFSNANNVSFGLNGSTVTASIVPGGANINLSAGTTSSNGAAFTFSNANGVSFGLGTGANAGVMTATVATNYLTTAMASNAATISNVNMSAGTTSTNASAFTFSNANGVSFGLGTGANVGVITGSVATGGSVNISAGTTSQNLTNFVFSNSNNVSFGLNGSTITASIVPGGGSPFLAGISGGNTSGNTGTVSSQLVMAGGNNVTLSGSTVAGNMTVTISAAAQTADSMGIYAVSQSTAQSSSSTVDVRSLSIAGKGGVSVGMSAGSLIISGASGGGAGFTAGMSSDGSTAGTSGVVTGQIEFVGDSGIGLSQSVNGGSATISIIPGFTVSNWSPFVGGTVVGQTIGNGNIQVFPLQAPFCVTGTEINHLISGSLSTSSNASMAATLSIGVILMTRNASTMSVGTTGSTNFQFTNSSNNSIASLTGLRLVQIPCSFFMTPGEYYIGIISSLATAANNWWTGSNMFVGNGINFGGANLGVAANFSDQSALGAGMFSTNAWGFPTNIRFNQLSGTGASSQNRVPVIHFCNFTA